MTKILLVDDDEQIRFAMSEVLRARGYDIIVAADGDEAEKIMQKTPVNVVLLDIFMPERDGFETISFIRKSHPDMIIIAMSGYDDGSFKPLEYAKTLGADDVLPKPFSADQLVATLIRYQCKAALA